MALMAAQGSFSILSTRVLPPGVFDLVGGSLRVAAMPANG
jgi:hypothetical protein